MSFVDRIDKVVNWKWELTNTYECQKQIVSHIDRIARKGNGELIIYAQKQNAAVNDYSYQYYSLATDTLIQIPPPIGVNFLTANDFFQNSKAGDDWECGDE
jgi:hypothetical protein